MDREEGSPYTSGTARPSSPSYPDPSFSSACLIEEPAVTVKGF